MHLTGKNKVRLKLKGWKRILHANITQKQARVAILRADKEDFK
jgi:hypothetical protein